MANPYPHPHSSTVPGADVYPSHPTAAAPASATITAISSGDLSAVVAVTVSASVCWYVERRPSPSLPGRLHSSGGGWVAAANSGGIVSAGTYYVPVTLPDNGTHTIAVWTEDAGAAIGLPAFVDVSGAALEGSLVANAVPVYPW